MERWRRVDGLRLWSPVMEVVVSGVMVVVSGCGLRAEVMERWWRGRRSMHDGSL